MNGVKVANIKQYFCFLFLLLSILLSFCVPAQENNLCLPKNLNDNPQHVLPCYVKQSTTSPANWKLMKTEPENSLTVYTYELTSQFWPDKTLSKSGKVWQHTLILHVPKQIKNNQAFLYINSGINSKNDFKMSPKGLSDLAKKYGSVVVDLHDVPNQYLTFDDGVPRKEDGIVAYTWNKYMENPSTNAYWPVQLPMVKSVVEAMNAVQAIATIQKYSKVPEQFVLSGASKRGWATWLTSLVDKRVHAIIPIVIDIFNIENNIAHIHNSLGKWPFAFHDYAEQGRIKNLHSKEFRQLAKIIDPISYRKYPEYKSRLAIPKLIINASSDDFFVPDSLLQYVDQLSGNNTIKILPNQNHNVNFTNVDNPISEYFGLLLEKKTLPQLTWNENKNSQYIEVTTDFIPSGEVTHWQAKNKNVRDFRLRHFSVDKQGKIKANPTGIQYQASTIKGNCNKQRCTFRLLKAEKGKAYQAQFLEFPYRNGAHAFTTTSPVFITPDVYQNQ